MRVETIWLRRIALSLALVFALGMVALPGAQSAAWAQTAPVHHKKNFAQRHPTLTSAAAGYAAYKVAKKTGHNRALMGRRKNFAQRHPFLTGAAAAMATHHVIKKSLHKNPPAR